MTPATIRAPAVTGAGVGSALPNDASVWLHERFGVRAP